MRSFLANDGKGMNMLSLIRTGELIASRACALTHSMYIYI